MISQKEKLTTILFYNKFGKAHKIYADRAFLDSNQYLLNEEFFQGESKCHIPEKICDNYGYFEEIPFKALFKSKKESPLVNLDKSKVKKSFFKTNP